MSFVAGQRVTAGELNAINSVQIVQTSTLSATTASVTITIPSGYGSLDLSWHARTTSANTSDNMLLRFNNDSGANYDWQIVAGLNTTVTTTPSIGATSLLIGTAVGGTGTSGYFSNGVARITGASQAASGHVLTVTGSWYACWSNTAATSQAGTTGGLYIPSASITSLTLLPAAGSFAAGSVFSLYGFN